MPSGVVWPVLATRLTRGAQLQGEEPQGTCTISLWVLKYVFRCWSVFRTGTKELWDKCLCLYNIFLSQKLKCITKCATTFITKSFSNLLSLYAKGEWWQKASIGVALKLGAHDLLYRLKKTTQILGSKKTLVCFKSSLDYRECILLVTT